MIYLASPYSHPDPAVERERRQQAIEMTKTLIERSVSVFSPIVYSTALLDAGCRPVYNDWLIFDFDFVRRATELWIFTLPGWRESAGVKAEAALAFNRNIPVYLYSPNGELTPCYKNPFEEGVKDA